MYLPVPVSEDDSLFFKVQYVADMGCQNDVVS